MKKKEKEARVDVDDREQRAPGAEGGSSREVARQFRRGDPGAVEATRARVRRILSFRAYRMPREDRRDLEQEVMAQLWREVGRDSFREDAGFWGFVEVVTARRSIDWLRMRRQTGPLPESLAEKGSGPLGRVLAREREELAYAALARLGKECRELIYLQAGLRLPYRKIARILGRSEGALRTQMSRCLERARRILPSLSDPARRDAGGREAER